MPGKIFRKNSDSPLALLFFSATTNASIIAFDLQGKAGFGLLGGNENPAAVNGGSGGETGAGIFFDDITNIFTINTAWGVANGFTSLTGNATAGHLHGPTTSGGVAAFTQNAGVKYPLNSLVGWNANALSGGFNGTVSILLADVAALKNGQFYMNVHTAANPGGEIRGNLVPAVPEPSSLGLLLFGLVAFPFYGRNAVRRKALGSE
jgi:hypothetical protein